MIILIKLVDFKNLVGFLGLVLFQGSCSRRFQCANCLVAAQGRRKRGHHPVLEKQRSTLWLTEHPTAVSQHIKNNLKLELSEDLNIALLQCYQRRKKFVTENWRERKMDQ